MCILMVIHKSVQDYPVVLAANRDEFYNRPASPPQCLSQHFPLIWGGKDERAGGTWLGVNMHGVVVGLTNRRLKEDQTNDPQRRSRGLVCLEVLQHLNALEAAEFVAKEPLHRYNPFNLLIADQQNLLWVAYDEKAVIQQLTPGIHILANGNINDLETVRIRRARHLLKNPQPIELSLLLPFLEQICRDHEIGVKDRETICMHRTDITYGTVSSTIMAISQKTPQSIYRYASGSPCTNLYQDYSQLLQI